MVGKEIMLFLNNGDREAVICIDFKIGMDAGVPALLCQVSQVKMYVVPLSKIHHWDIRYVWIFDGWIPPQMPDAPTNSPTV